MPTTLTALIVVVVGIIPGVLGELIYQIVAGSNWRESEWERAIRIIAISVAGLVITLVLAAILSHPEELHSPVREGAIEISMLMPWITIYAVHFLASSIIGALIAFGSREISDVSRLGAYPDTWDVFARRLVLGHWVVVALKDGSSYAGMIERADISVRVEERDLVLAEPAQFDPTQGTYIVTQYQYLYLPAALIASVAVYYDPAIDQRLTSVNSVLFKAGNG